MPDYKRYLRSASGPAWKRLGTVRRAGILAPLFSIQSRRSGGVGEFPDLELLADWCRECGMSLIQLLPLNDVGTRFCPYDAESSFALEPMHLALGDLADVPADESAQAASDMRGRYPAGTTHFDTRVKRDKLGMLQKLFARRPAKRPEEFEAFVASQRVWLEDYVLFKVAKGRMQEKAWEAWPQPLKRREPSALRDLAARSADETEFHRWVQWQAYRQFRRTSENVRRKQVFLVGDLPFLVARDSADVWARPSYFKLGLSAGAPPDLYFADGQEWGMPPYDWAAMAAQGYDYMKQKLKFAGSFYDLYRLDHFVGLFRVWTFPTDKSDRKKQAAFDPPDEKLWEKQARGILGAMLKATPMLPCAEDLGTVPDSAREVLKEFAIPGMDVQRWMRDWKGRQEFLPAGKYRTNAIVTISTHDMSSFYGWWKNEATEEDQRKFLRFLGVKRAGPLEELLAKALEKASGSAAIFSIQSFQDLMTFCGVFGETDAALRVNQPGIVSGANWCLRIPRPLEEFAALPGNAELRRIHEKSKRE